MSPEVPTSDPNIIVAAAPIVILAMGALATLRRSDEAIVRAFSVTSDSAISRLPIDVTAPRFDLPSPRHFDKVNTYGYQPPSPVRRWGGYFPGGY